MNYEEKILTEKIMRRVRFIYSIKNNAPAFVVKFALLAFLVVAGSLLVSVPNVIRNMPSVFEIGHFANFFLAAFISTSIVMQAILLGTIASISYIIRDIVKTFRGAAIGQTASV